MTPLPANAPSHAVATEPSHHGEKPDAASYYCWKNAGAEL